MELKHFEGMKKFITSEKFRERKATVMGEALTSSLFEEESEQRSVWACPGIM